MPKLWPGHNHIFSILPAEEPILNNAKTFWSILTHKLIFFITHHMYRTPENKLWYVIPILFGVIGGFVIWFILRKSDPNMARNCLLVGALSSLVSMTLYFALGSWEQTEPLPWNA